MSWFNKLQGDDDPGKLAARHGYDVRQALCRVLLNASVTFAIVLLIFSEGSSS